MPRELIIGVSGGIAAFKSAALVSSLVQKGHGVSVVMTRAARKFVGPATFRALTTRPVVTDAFDPHFPLGAHIELAEKSEINANAKDTKDYPKGVWTLPPSLRLGDEDREKYLAIGESDRMTLKFVKPAS